MTLIEFARMLDERGPESSHWPEDRRQDAMDFVARNPTAQLLLDNCLSRARELDQLLSQLRGCSIDANRFSRLQCHILSQSLPARSATMAERLIAWLFRSREAFSVPVVRPVTFAALLLVAGFILGKTIPFSTLATPESDPVLEYELFLLSLKDYPEPVALP